MDKILKLKLVKIWEILSQETDEDHPMGTTAILEKLREIGIECDRRTLYADIEALNACGYEILCRRSTSNVYYVKDRKFSIAEIRIMMDAVQAAGFITDQETEKFIDKLAFLAGSRRGETLKDNLVAYNNTKTDNPDIYRNVETITEAIQQNKKVKFTYFSSCETLIFAPGANSGAEDACRRRSGLYGAVFLSKGRGIIQGVSGLCSFPVTAS